MINLDDLTAVENAALGAFLGAAAADAAGGVLEFLGRTPTQGDVERALSQPGGGVWGLAKGQITDDTELAISLAEGLINASSTYSGDTATTSPTTDLLDSILSAYGKWYRSPPFDIGNTTTKALRHLPKDPTPGFSVQAIQRTAHRNADTHANGSLMRATPLGVYCYKMTAMEAGKLGAADSSLTHPNQTICGAEAAYVAAVAHLIKNTGDNKGAFDAARNVLVSKIEYSETLEWLRTAERGEKTPYEPMQGWAKIAFTHAFRHLLLQTPYEDALQETLLGGGDTDTNAAIVCGLLGALHGIRAVPQGIWRPVLVCDTEKMRGRRRPEWLAGGRIPGLVRRLLEVAPESVL